MVSAEVNQSRPKDTKVGILPNKQQTGSLTKSIAKEISKMIVKGNPRLETVYPAKGKMWEELPIGTKKTKQIK